MIKVQPNELQVGDVIEAYVTGDVTVVEVTPTFFIVECDGTRTLLPIEYCPWSQIEVKRPTLRLTLVKLVNQTGGYFIYEEEQATKLQPHFVGSTIEHLDIVDVPMEGNVSMKNRLLALGFATGLYIVSDKQYRNVYAIGMLAALQEWDKDNVGMTENRYKELYDELRSIGCVGRQIATNAVNQVVNMMQEDDPYKSLVRGCRDKYYYNILPIGRV